MKMNILHNQCSLQKSIETSEWDESCNRTNTIRWELKIASYNQPEKQMFYNIGLLDRWHQLGLGKWKDSFGFFLQYYAKSPTLWSHIETTFFRDQHLPQHFVGIQTEKICYCLGTIKVECGHTHRCQLRKYKK